jgi:hypothetical protein
MDAQLVMPTDAMDMPTAASTSKSAYGGGGSSRLLLYVAVYIAAAALAVLIFLWIRNMLRPKCDKDEECRKRCEDKDGHYDPHCFASCDKSKRCLIKRNVKCKKADDCSGLCDGGADKCNVVCDEDTSTCVQRSTIIT